MQLAGKVAIVTGASSGIGYAAAKLFAQEGARIVAVARRRSELERLAAKIAAVEAAINRFARAALFLASDASSFVTGAALSADGGVSIVRARQ